MKIFVLLIALLLAGCADLPSDDEMREEAKNRPQFMGDNW